MSNISSLEDSGLNRGSRISDLFIRMIRENLDIPKNIEFLVIGHKSGFAVFEIVEKIDNGEYRRFGFVENCGYDCHSYSKDSFKTIISIKN